MRLQTILLRQRDQSTTQGLSMNTFFRINTQIYDPLTDMMAGITSGPYLSKLEALTIMMDHKILILFPWSRGLRGRFSSHSKLSFSVQECIIIDQQLEVINEPFTEECSYSDFTELML